MQQLSNEGSPETSWGDVDPWWEVSPTGRKIGGEIVYTARSSLQSSTQPLGKDMIQLVPLGGLCAMVKVSIHESPLVFLTPPETRAAD